MVAECGTEIFACAIWDKIPAGKLIGHYDERKPNEYHAADYGTVYRNSVTNIICDKFGAQRRHKENGNVLIFDVNKLVKIGKSYDAETHIQLKLSTEEKTEGSEGSEGFRKEQDIIGECHSIERTNKQFLH